MTDDEFYTEIMAEEMEISLKIYLKEKQKTENILKVVKKIKGKIFINDLKLICDGENLFSKRIEITKKPYGNLVNESYGCKSIKSFFVDQHHTGSDSYDDFYGKIYVEIKPNIFLSMDYYS